jgi:hypothetical protein
MNKLLQLGLLIDDDQQGQALDQFYPRETLFWYCIQFWKPMVAVTQCLLCDFFLETYIK